MVLNSARKWENDNFKFIEMIYWKYINKIYWKSNKIICKSIKKAGSGWPGRGPIAATGRSRLVGGPRRGQRHGDVLHLERRRKGSLDQGAKVRSLISHFQDIRQLAQVKPASRQNSPSWAPVHHCRGPSGTSTGKNVRIMRLINNF